MYPPEAQLVVYDLPVWWGDSWNALDHGREFDFSRPFFEQFAELRAVVPRMSVVQHMTENSLYTSYVSNLKDCYLLFTSDFNRECAYGVWVENSRDCFNNYYVDQCELAAYCLFSQSIYSSSFVVRSSQCSDSAFLFDCRNCAHCFLCHGLRNKSYCFENVQCTPEEYRRLRAQHPLASWRVFEECQRRFHAMVGLAPHLFIWRNGRIVDSTGDFLVDVENCHECYETVRSKDCLYCLGVELKDSVDCTYANADLGYENCECFPQPHRSAFNLNTYTGRNLYYCDQCMNDCADCFGSIGLKHQRYCILNRRYAKDEYEQLATRIIEYMRGTEEWGQFFPIELSTFPYNESLGQDYFPVERAVARRRGWWWSDRDREEFQPATCSLPDHLLETPDSISSERLSCQLCGRNYRIISQELSFHRNLQLALPRSCFECRLAEWKVFRNPRKLFDRLCSDCRCQLRSTYASDRHERVLCERCYERALY